MEKQAVVTGKSSETNVVLQRPEAFIPAKAEILMLYKILHLKPIFSNTE